MIDSELKFHVNVNVLIGKDSTFSKNILISTVCRSIKFMLTMYVSHMRPICEYRSCVWQAGYLEDEHKLEQSQPKLPREVGLTGLDYV